MLYFVDYERRSYIWLLLLYVVSRRLRRDLNACIWSTSSRMNSSWLGVMKPGCLDLITYLRNWEPFLQWTQCWLIDLGYITRTTYECVKTFILYLSCTICLSCVPSVLCQAHNVHCSVYIMSCTVLYVQ